MSDTFLHNVYLYTFHKGGILIHEGFRQDKVGNEPRRLQGMSRFLTSKGKSFWVSDTEGEVYNNQLWLSEKDDEKALELFLKAAEYDYIDLKTKINVISNKIDALSRLKKEAEYEIPN